MCIDAVAGRGLLRATGWRAAFILLPFLGNPAAVADDASGPGAALSGGKPSLDLRYRFEHVSQDGMDEDANGSTLRLRLNYETGSYRRLSGFAEFDYVSELLFDDFNSGGGTSPGRSQYPVIADPHGADLNQLYIDYKGVKNLAVRAGRQRFLLDNQRFVGGVGWRQNEQTYDGVNFRYNIRPGTRLQYAYVSRVNRIFGDRVAAGRHDADLHLLNLKIDISGHWTVSPYAYRIDNDDVAAFSTTTTGVRVVGELGESRRLRLAADVATQADAAESPVSYRAGYLRLDADMAVSDALSLGVGFESLSGDRIAVGEAFRTPLATLHAFQGWADQFLVTPDAGIEDLFASLSYTRAGWNFLAVYHQFAAESGSADWGRELDLSVSRKLGERYGVLFKAALFNADEAPFEDVTKGWVMLTAGF